MAHSPPWNTTNTTLPIATAIPTTDYSHPNSRASVFSTILALCLCCLTQPRGGLLFPGRSAWFWRLSPISAALEALIILFCLLFRRRPARAGNGSEDAENIAIGFGRSSAILGGWQDCACVLLLLRSGWPLSSSPSMPGPLEEVRNAPKRLHLWTTVTMVFLTIKLCSVRGAPLFTVLGLCYSASWFAVEALLLLASWRQISEAEVNRIIAEYEDNYVAAVASHPVWRRTWSVLTGIPGTGATVYNLWLRGFEKTEKTAAILGSAPILVFFGIFLLLSIFKPSIPWGQTGANSVSRALFIVVSFAVVALVSAGLYYNFAVYDHRQEHQLSLFEVANFGLYGFLVMFGICIGAVLALQPLLLSLSIAADSKYYVRQTKIRISMMNVVFFGGALTLYLYYYDSEGTLKPEWLEWIGM